MESRPISLKDLYRLSTEVSEDADESPVIAVLLAEAVGSAAYFESRGDRAGREWLQAFREIASKHVGDSGGVLAGSPGDRTLSYFKKPGGAVGASIKIQKAFDEYNTEKAPDDRIPVRIGIHCGEVIIEGREVYGNVVNLLSKLVPLLSPGEICITQPVYDLVRNDTPVKILPRKFEKNEVSEELPAHRLVWEEAGGRPETVALLFMKPLWNMAGQEFAEAWSKLIAEKDRLHGENALAENIGTDKSVALAFSHPDTAADYAKLALDFLARFETSNGVSFMPIQTIIDSGLYLMADRMILDRLRVDWMEIYPGEIHVSKRAAAMMGNDFDPPFSEDGTNEYYTFARTGRERKNRLFKYRGFLSLGSEPTCFYCGDKRHPAVNCPSKNIEDYTPDALEKLRYMPFPEINRLFFGSLAGYDSTESRLADNGFYDLSVLFQLRFIRAVWNPHEEDWDRVKTKKRKTRTGGHLWLAFDCIRISNPERAEDLLEISLREYPHDFKVYCGLGFLFMERNDIEKAQYYFEQAVYYAKTKPQLIYTQFLLLRLFFINGHYFEAERKIWDILNQFPECPEARYFRIKFEFINGSPDKALADLARFVCEKGDFFIIAMLDPDLSTFDGPILDELETQFNNARDEAERIAPEAWKQLDRLKSVAGETDSEIGELDSLRERIGELSGSQSYSARLDVVRYSNLIVERAARMIEERKNRIIEILDSIYSLCTERIEFVKNYPYLNFIHPLYEGLRDIASNIVKTREQVQSESPEIFKKALERAKSFSREISDIDNRIQRLKIFLQVRNFLAAFLKRAAVFLVADLFIVLGIFPLAWIFTVVVLEISIEFWQFCQKMFVMILTLFILLGVGGLLAAVILTMNKLYPGRK